MTLLVDDRDLLDAFRRGERRAYDAIYREYARGLLAYLRGGFTFAVQGKPYRFAGYADPWEQENLVHEVFVRAFSERARLAYDGLRPYRNYLLTIARNLVMDDFRRRERRFSPLDESAEAMDAAAPPTVAAPPPDPERQLEYAQLVKHAEAFYAELDGLEQAVFQARFRRGASIEATARELALTEHRVKKLEQRIRQRFFKRMKQLGYFEGYRYDRKGL